MKHVILYLILFACVQNYVFAQSEFRKPLYERNFVQFDPLYFRVKSVSSSSDAASLFVRQIITTRPSLLVNFNLDDIILKSFFSISPDLTNTAGSFEIGQLIYKLYDFGLYTSFVDFESTQGSGANANGFVSSSLFLGPYFAMYPFVRKDMYLKVYGRFAFESIQKSTTLSGATTNITQQTGFEINVNVLFSFELNSKLYYSPSVNFTTSFTNDQVGAAAQRTGLDFEVIPISLQIPF